MIEIFLAGHLYKLFCNIFNKISQYFLKKKNKNKKHLFGFKCMVVAYANVVHMMLMCNKNILIFTFVSSSCIYQNKLHSSSCVSWQDVRTHLDYVPLFKTIGCIWYTLCTIVLVKKTHGSPNVAVQDTHTQIDNSFAQVKLSFVQSTFEM